MPDKRAIQSAINGAKSNGANTPAGLAKCFEAARKLRKPRPTTLLPGEDPAPYETLRASLHALWQPENAAEVQMVDELSSIMWILKREIDPNKENFIHHGYRSVYSRSLRTSIRRRNRIINVLCDRKIDT
jgi:hypothetical protein